MKHFLIGIITFENKQNIVFFLKQNKFMHKINFGEKIIAVTILNTDKKCFWNLEISQADDSNPFTSWHTVRVSMLLEYVHNAHFRGLNLVFWCSICYIYEKVMVLQVLLHVDFPFHLLQVDPARWTMIDWNRKLLGRWVLIRELAT